MTTAPNPKNDGDLALLVHKAAQCLIAQQPVAVTHPPGWERDGFPLPIKKQKPDQDGFLRQEYRPLAVLEYAHEVLSGEMASRRAMLRARQESSHDR